MQVMHVRERPWIWAICAGQGWSLWLLHCIQCSWACYKCFLVNVAQRFSPSWRMSPYLCSCWGLPSTRVSIRFLNALRLDYLCLRKGSLPRGHWAWSLLPCLWHFWQVFLRACHFHPIRNPITLFCRLLIRPLRDAVAHRQLLGEQSRDFLRLCHQ